jgi:selenocysteine lyase/cysteine desulfurase
MTHRRSFLTQMASVAGATGLAGLVDVQRAVALEVRRIAAEGQRPSPLTRLRDRYLLSPDVTYFNHASIGTVPRVVHEAHLGYLSICETNPWLYMWGGAWEESRARVRAAAARLLHCAPGEMALTHNTTEGFSMLANGLALGPGDEVVFSSLNHDGASVCWFHNAKAKGFTVRQFAFPVLDVPHMTADDVLDVYDRHITSRTRVLVFPHIDNIVGLRYPVKRLTALAKERGVDIVAVDGAQSVGMLDVDVHDFGVDVYAASSHKWLQAPKGLGLLYIRQGVQEQMRPMWVTWGQERWKGTSRIFEDYGTRDLPAVLALADALDFQEALGSPMKVARYRALWQHFQAAAARAGIAWRSPQTWSLAASLYALEIDDSDSRAVFDRMYRENGVVFRAFRTQGLNTVRISPNVVNTEEEIDRFVEAVRH